jgi:hypothetical protein
METLDSHVGSSDLRITETVRAAWRTQAFWAKLTGIITIVLLALGFLFVLFSGSMIAIPGLGFLFIVFYGVFLLLTILLYWQMYSHGKLLKEALDTDDQESLTQATYKLGTFAKILGILLFIVAGLYAIIFLFGIITTAVALSN